MVREVIDAEFVVVSAPLRFGDQHPTRPRWRYVRTDRISGMTIWYIAPRFTRWQLFALICVFTPVAVIGLSYLAELVDHYWPR